MNTLSHKKVYYFESAEVVLDNMEMFEEVFTGLKKKYGFVLHAPAPAVAAGATAAAPPAAK